MLILVGGSASGKSTIEKILCTSYGYKKVTSYTTRSPRDGEVDGVDYHFISEDDFNEKRHNGFFAEVGCYNGWFYGSAIEDCTNDKIAVLTPHGMRQLKQKSDIDIFSVYIEVDRRDRLIRILERNDNIEEAKRRDASDVGQFDGIKDEVNETINNDGYKKTPLEMTEKVNSIYQEYLNSQKEKSLTILCDIDEVVNNLVEEILNAYNKKYNDSLTFEMITHYNMNKFVKDECENVFDEFCNDELLVDLSLQPKAKEVIENISKKHNLYYLTSTFPRNVFIKDDWLKRLIPGYDSGQLIVCRNKRLVHGDILIDDYLENFDKIRHKEEPVKYNLIFDKPWNREFKEENNKNFRVHNWDEIEEFINGIRSNN